MSQEYKIYLTGNNKNDIINEISKQMTDRLCGWFLNEGMNKTIEPIKGIIEGSMEKNKTNLLEEVVQKYIHSTIEKFDGNRYLLTVMLQSNSQITPLIIKAFRVAYSEAKGDRAKPEFIHNFNRSLGAVVGDAGNKLVRQSFVDVSPGPNTEGANPEGANPEGANPEGANPKLQSGGKNKRKQSTIRKRYLKNITYKKKSIMRGGKFSMPKLNIAAGLKSALSKGANFAQSLGSGIGEGVKGMYNNIKDRSSQYAPPASSGNLDDVIKNRSAQYAPSASSGNLDHVIKDYGGELVNRMKGRISTTGNVLSEKVIHGIGNVIEKNPQVVNTILSPVIEKMAQKFSEKLAGNAFDLLFYQLLINEMGLFTDSINEMSEKHIKKSTTSKMPLKMDYMIDDTFVLGSIDIFTKKMSNEIYSKKGR